MKRRRLFLSIAALGLGSMSGLSVAQLVTTEFIIDGFNGPVFATAPSSDANRLWVVEKQGVVRIVDLTTNTVRNAPFLAVPGVVADNQDGLLGFAFDPDYATNRYSYVAYTAIGNQGRSLFVDRYTTSAVNPELAMFGSRRSVMTVPLTPGESIHAGGWIGFSPNDKMLYVAVGDGGPQNDPNNHAQNMFTQMGKMLRINPYIDAFLNDPANNYGVPPGNPTYPGYTGPGVGPGMNVDMNLAIWASGLRHPWRNSFDRLTGDLWIADVSQDLFEEINFHAGNTPAPPLAGWGPNYGWRNSDNGPWPIEEPNVVEPVFQYSAAPLTSIVGGYVNRAPNLQGPLQGKFFFTDVYDSVLYAYDLDTDSVSNLVRLADPGTVERPKIVSFGEDAIGRIYVVNYAEGSVLRLVPEPTTYAMALAGMACGGFSMWSHRRRHGVRQAWRIREENPSTWMFQTPRR